MQAVVAVIIIQLLTGNKKKSEIDKLTHLINTQTDKIINQQTHEPMNP